MKSISQAIFLKLCKSLWLAAVFSMALCANAFAQNICPQPGDVFTVYKQDTNSLNTGRLLIIGPGSPPVLVMADMDTLTVVSLPGAASVGPFVIDQDIVGNSRNASSLAITKAEASAAGWQQLPYQSYLVDISGITNGCLSLVLISRTANGPSYVVNFYPQTGQPVFSEKLNLYTAIFNSGTADIIVGNVNGDNRNDITVIDNGSVVGVLTATGRPKFDSQYGIFQADPGSSALAVWRAFSDAVKAKNFSLANRYFSPQFSATLAPSLQQNLDDLAITLSEIVDSEVQVISPDIVEIQLVVKTGTVFSAYTAVITSNAGVWKIDAY